MTADSHTPSAGPSSTFKPRLLYRGPLRLPDGTLLPGVAFVSTISPFDSSPSIGLNKDENYDAEICLALEMVRGQRVVGIDLLDETEANGRGNVGTTFAQPFVARKEIDVTLEATGKVKMYIDPREEATAAFFERHFCWRDDWTKTDPPRARIAFALSTTPTSHDFLSSDSQSQSQDPFAGSYSQSFGPTPLDRKTLQLVLFARLAEEKFDGSDGSRGLDILVGRRLIRRRRTKQPHEQPPRPDDPLPRVAALADLMLSQRGGPPPRVSSPTDLSRRKRLGSNKWQRDPSPGAASAPSPDQVAPNLSTAAPSDFCSSADFVGRARSAGGNHTPGRRGEKRHKAEVFAGATNGEPRGSGSPSVSPSKRRRADEMDLTTTSKRQFGSPSSSVSDLGLKSKKAGTLRPPPLTQASKGGAGANGGKLTPVSSAAVTPEPPDSAVFLSFGEATESTVKTEGLAGPLTKGEKEGKGVSGSVASVYSALELRNRGAIKKLVQLQLLGRGLDKSDEIFERCFTAAYHGTLLALRHTLASASVDRQQTASLIACHLAMYLPPTALCAAPLPAASGFISAPAPTTDQLPVL